MTRRWFALASSIVLCSMLVTAAAAQSSSNGTTGQSFLGKWFGRRDNSQQNSFNQQGNNGRQMQKSAKAQPSPQVRKDQMPPDPAATQTDALPGLGGSPLPRNPGQATTSNAAPKTSASQYPAQPKQANGTPRNNTTGPSARRTASRQLDVSAPAGVPRVSPSTASNSNNSSNAANRQSPSRRATPNINPNDLRNELSGSFENPSTPSQPAARTARANKQNDTATNPVTAEKTNKSDANENAPVLTAAPVTKPENEQPSTPAEKPAKQVEPVQEPKLHAHTSEDQPHSAADAFDTKKESLPTFGASSFVRTPYSNAPPAGAQTVRGKEAFGEALQVAGGGDPNVLASNQTPVLTADIRGPKQILIGREAVYRVRLQNQSDIPAEGIVATVRIPSGADIMNATATQGTVQQPQDAAAKGQMQWQIARLDRHAGETLELRLVPRENRPLELGVNWVIAPVGSRAVVEVQEPKLQLEIAGPAEVMYDKPQVFKLTISNPGTGPAENVKIELMPPGSGKDAAAKENVTSHTLGDLPAGGSQSVEVELTAREAGKMFVKAIAAAEGGLTSNASKEVFCRKPELEVDWRGPATKYAGTLATYFLRVRNPGTAAAEDVTVRASLPEGAEYISASEGQVFDTKLREVAWKVGTLRPGDDNYMEIKCVLKNAGANQLKITAANVDGNLTDTKTAATNVVALADLKLEVSDPSGPVAVGSPAIYEIHIKNRGANTAKDVTVVGLFSDGIEPEQAEGAMYTVTDGRVSFRTIEDLPAGRDVVLRIRAHAVQPGTHVFRAEVLCKDLEIKLAAEETARFYADDTPENTRPQKQAAGRSEAFQSTVR